MAWRTRVMACFKNHWLPMCLAGEMFRRKKALMIYQVELWQKASSGSGLEKEGDSGVNVQTSPAGRRHGLFEHLHNRLPLLLDSVLGHLEHLNANFLASCMGLQDAIE